MTIPSIPPPPWCADRLHLFHSIPKKNAPVHDNRGKKTNHFHEHNSTLVKYAGRNAEAKVSIALDDLLARFDQKERRGDGWQVRCPVHDDKTPSLSICEKGGKIMLYCHAGCSFEKIRNALSLSASDTTPGAGNASQPNIVAEYSYQDETGKELFQVVRLVPKSFRQRHRDPDGEWVWKKSPRLVLFQLPKVLDAIRRGLPVLIAEGEKDCLALGKRGFTATCNPGGAVTGNNSKKWLPEYNEMLRRADVVIVPDNDEPGREHAERVASMLCGTSKRVRVVELPQERDGHEVKDVSDFLSAGAEASDLFALIDAAKDWQPNAIESHEKSNCWIRGEIISLLLADIPRATKRVRIADRVVEALQKLGHFYYHADLRDFDSAMFFDAERKRLERIRSDAFIAWLSEWLGINRADSVFRFVLAAIETAALSGSQTTGIIPENFWASRPGAIYLSTGDGAAVKITRDSVQLVDNGTDAVLFAAGRTLAHWRLIPPRDPFVTCSLFRDAHCSATHGRDLLQLWLYSVATNPGSKPPLCLAGEIGSGKTRLAKGFAELLGVPFVAAKVEEDGESQFWPAIDQGGIFTLDNADSKCRWLADALAIAATAGCSPRRKLYTNAETVTLRARAWLCVTTANPTFASDAGLADRLLLVRMERHGDETSDARLTQEILAAREGALSHLAQTLSRALADDAPVPSKLNARHPDFASFAVRIGRALGRETQTIAALRTAEADKASFCLENDNIAAALLGHLESAKSFTGTAAELVPHLIAVDPELVSRLSAKSLGKRLSGLWPHLTASLNASKQKNRDGTTIFSFSECGVCGVSN